LASDNAGQQLQYLAGSVEDNSQISPETRQVIDGEVQRFVTEQYKRAQELLKKHHPALRTLAKQLLKQETVSGSVVKEALENSPSSGSAADGVHIEESRQGVSG
jgi:ATP-dependent Zn protease